MRIDDRFPLLVCGLRTPYATMLTGIRGFLLRGCGGAQTEISLATLAYNLKRMLAVLGGASLRAILAD